MGSTFSSIIYYLDDNPKFTYNCRDCNKQVYYTQSHCFKCNICTNKNNYHCNICNTCVNENYIHCQKCHTILHKCEYNNHSKVVCDPNYNNIPIAKKIN